MTIKFTVALLQEAVEDLQRLEDFAIEREPSGEAPDWATPQRSLDALRAAMRLLSWSPYSCRRQSWAMVAREVRVHGVPAREAEPSRPTGQPLGAGATGGASGAGSIDGGAVLSMKLRTA